MSGAILLVSSSEGFSELIRQALMEESDYAVSVSNSGVEALGVAQEIAYELAIIDCDLEDMPFNELISTLQIWLPNIRIIVVPPDNDPHHEALEKIHPHAFLTKPFYLPDLVKIVDKVLQGERVDISKIPKLVDEAEDHPNLNENGVPRMPEPKPVEQDQEFPWLSDVDHAAQHLARLSMQTASQAALITRGEALWAYAGGFPQDVVQELAETVVYYWERYGGADLARFIRLDALDDEFMLYATSLPEDMVLALVFDAETPFSQIRSQASRLAQALSSRSLSDTSPYRITEIAEGAESEDGAESDEESKILSESVMEHSEPSAAMESLTEPAVSENPALPMDWMPPSFTQDDEIREEIEEIEPFDFPSDWQPDQPPSEGRRNFLDELLADPLPSIPFPYEASVEAEVEDDREATADTKPVEPGLTRPSHTFPDEKPIFPPPEHMAETRPTQVMKETEPVLPLEPASAGLYNLNYACVLIPRFPSHHLVGDLAELLSKWIPQVCVAFGWRVEHLSVRPDYVQWMVNVPPATSPAYLMRIIGKITSQRIFHKFPHFTEENPSGEFWAPGYLIISKNNLPTPAMIQDFISKTRQRQGLI